MLNGEERYLKDKNYNCPFIVWNLFANCSWLKINVIFKLQTLKSNEETGNGASGNYRINFFSYQLTCVIVSLL